jgi:hypothetical protein
VVVASCRSAVGGGAAAARRRAAVGLLGAGELDRVKEHDAEAGLQDVVGVRVLGDALGSGGLDPRGLLDELVAGRGELGEAAGVSLTSARRSCAFSRSKPPAAAEARAYSAITSSVDPTAACLATGGACVHASAVTLGRSRAR